MKQRLAHVALVVRDYDEAIEFFCGKLNFDLVEDQHQPDENKRWVLIAPPGSGKDATAIVLSRARDKTQAKAIGNQTGGRVFLFLQSDDFWRDYNHMIEAGINFVRQPKQADYGIVAVFEDLYGNWWDLVGFS